MRLQIAGILRYAVSIRLSTFRGVPPGPFTLVNFRTIIGCRT